MAEQLTCHADDERRHAKIFAQALRQLNKQVIDFSQIPPRKADGTPDERRRSPFFAAYFESYSQEDLRPAQMDWLVFFASTYILELDASQDFVRMANTLPEQLPRDCSLKQGMLSIAEDETRHASYLREAMARKLPATVVEAAIDTWRTRKVKAMLALVRGLMERGGQMPSLVQDGMPLEPEELAPEMV